jgi:VWFA-related protein
MSLRGAIVSCFLLPALVLLQSQSQAPEPDKPATTLKTTVRRVLVDVVVTNDKGRPVTGLHEKDFEVLEDGKQQTISTFAEHTGATPTEIKLPPMPPHVYTNFPVTQTTDSINVVLLDALNTQTRDQTYVHWQMIKYLKTIPPGTRVAIFTLSSRLRMLQGITTESSELLAALNIPQAATQPSGVLTSTEEADELHHLVDFLEANSGPAPAPSTLAQAEVDPINSLKEFLAEAETIQTETRIGITLQAFQQLARYLGSVPGRKNVIWFSGSFPIVIFPNGDLANPFVGVSNFQNELRKTADLLSADQVALYPVAAEGLASDLVYQANGEELGSKRPSLSTRDQIQRLQSGQSNRSSNQSTMDELAKDTGGKAYYNTNGLSDALARVIDNGTHYYSLTYEPGNPATDGKYRHIQVRLIKAKGTLAYRRGYYADDLGTILAAGQKPETDPLLMLMGRNLPEYSQILYKIKVVPSDPQPPSDAPRIGNNPNLKGPITRYGVDFAISPRDLKLDATPDGGRHGNIEIALIAYNREGKPLNFVVTSGDINLDPKLYASVQQVGLQIHKEIDVPREYIYLRTGIYDFKLSTAGTLGVPLNDTMAPTTK